MQYLSVFLPLVAMAGGALAGPAWGDKDDACLAAVTGSAALGDGRLRASHCASYLATTVTPISTETVYLTGNGHDNWKRATVAYCPNEVPNYASACDDAHYTSACSRFGFTNVLTTTVAPTTTTKTIWVRPTGGPGGPGGPCSATTITKPGYTSTVTVVKDGSAQWTATTVTVTVATPTTVTVNGPGSSYTPSVSTVTVTVSGPSSTYTPPSSKCNVDDALATQLVNNFVELLEFTNFPGGGGIPAGRGYHQATSDATLATTFQDLSDSINFMSGKALGAISFESKSEFDQGQGFQPEVSVDILDIWHDCDSITWRWNIVSTLFPVTGLQHMLVNDDLLISRNYVEFDNAAWLQSFGQNCSFGPVATPVAPSAKRSLIDLYLDM